MGEADTAVLIPVAVYGCYRGTRCDVAVAFLVLELGCWLSICLLFVFIPIFVVARIFNILFEIGHRPAVGAEEVGPRWPDQNRADAFVMPDV
jgi:hypothetical protein